MTKAKLFISCNAFFIITNHALFAFVSGVRAVARCAEKALSSFLSSHPCPTDPYSSVLHATLRRWDTSHLLSQSEQGSQLWNFQLPQESWYQGASPRFCADLLDLVAIYQRGRRRHICGGHRA